MPYLNHKIVNISGFTQPFFTKQGPLDSQLDNKSFHHIIEVFSNTFKNSPESLLHDFSDFVEVYDFSDGFTTQS